MLVTFKSLHKSIEIKALAFDLDGTLLGPGSVLTDRTLGAVRSCAGKGLQIILATGRGIESTEKYRIAIGAGGPMVYFNGALIADMPSEKILHTTLLSKSIAEFCVDLSRQRKIYFQFYIPGMPNQPLLAETDDPQRAMYHRHTGILAEIRDLKDVLNDPHTEGCIKCMFLAEPDVLDNLRPVIEERFGKDAYVVRSTSTFLEILNPNVSKGLGLGLALKQCNIRPNEVIAFGDEENDLPMFEHAGLSVAPANAKEKVRAKADITTGPNSEDGIAVFLEENL